MHHDESQSNKKSTPTSDIAPGAPIWYRSSSGVHNNRDAGYGYGAQDPVSLTSADTRGNKGGYTSGSSVTRFGKISVDENRLIANHGSITKLTLRRTGGTVGDQVVTLRILREKPDLNTAKIGPVRGPVVDGFATCDNDIDLEVLNDPDIVYWDEQLEQFAILFKAGEDYVDLYFLVPYITSVASLEPAILNQPLTYRVDEYYATGASQLPLQFNNTYGDYTSHLEDQPDNLVINNHQTTYKIATLPVPGWWVDKVGADRVGVDQKLYSREIDRYQTHAIPLTGLVDNPPLYTVGKIRNVEASTYLRLDEMLVPPFSGTSFHLELSGQGIFPGGAQLNFDDPSDVTTKTGYDLGTHVVISTGGQFYDFSGEVTTSGTLTAPLTAEDVFTVTPKFEFKTYIGSNENIRAGSGYVSRILPLGSDPDDIDPDPVSPGRGGVVTWGTYDKAEMDPGGDSEFRWFATPEVSKLKYGNYLGVGDIAYPLFHWQGVDRLSMPDKQLKMVLTKSYPDAVKIHNEHPQLEKPEWLLHNTISAFYDLYNVKTRNGIIELGKNYLENEWVQRETVLSAISASLDEEDRADYMKSKVLYDLSKLTHDAEKSYINKSYLKGYYMTCTDHVDKKLIFQLDTLEAEPVFELGENRRVEMIITKSDPYTTKKHAAIEQAIAEATGESPMVLEKNVMKHRYAQGGVTWKTGDHWSDHGYNTPGAVQSASYTPQLTAGPTGEPLLSLLFGTPAVSAASITPPITGYTTQGPTSADDVTFLSLIPGVLNSTEFSKSADPADADPGTVSLSAIVYSDDAGVEFEAPLLVVDLKANTEPVIDIPMESFPTGALIWLYMSNPGGKTLSVLLDQMTLPPEDPTQPDNQTLVIGPKLLGTYVGEEVYYWYSKYNLDAGDLYSPSLATATIYEGHVTKLGGVATNGIHQFELDPLSEDDCLYAIDPNNLSVVDGPVDNTTTTTIKQIYQLYHPGEPIVQGTITFNFIR